MRSLFLAAGLALVLHALLFTLDAGWVRRHAFTTARPEPIRLSMSYKKPEPNLPPPEQKPLEVKKEPLPSKKQPQKKISETKPVRKIKPPRKETAPPIERKEQIQPAPAPTGPPPEAEPTIEREAPRIAHEETAAVPTPAPAVDEVVPLPPVPPIREAYPVYQKNPPPEYPRLARRRGYEGAVIMEVLVTRQGRVEDLRLFRSSGYPILDRAAMAAVKGWVFEPGRRGEERVEMWVKVPVRFRLQ